MELKDYREQPDEGIFEQIQHRLRVRRMVRIGGVTAAAILSVAVIAVAVVMTRGGDELAQQTVAAGQQVAVGIQQPVASIQQPEVEAQQAVAEEGSRKAPVAPAVKTMPMAEQSSVAEIPEEVVTEQPQPVMTVAPATVRPSAAAVAEPVAEAPSQPAMSTGDTKEQAPAEEPAKPAKNDPNPVIPVHYDNVVSAPNVIVPNGDVEANRIFSLKYSSEVTNFRIFIYNRGGRRLFSSSNPDFTWDGTANGVTLPQGAYVWVARFRDTDGRQREEKGTVTIIR
ncbi:MAG: gliding motility-associated C-terminal domain-containing protein [bacterium]